MPWVFVFLVSLNILYAVWHRQQVPINVTEIEPQGSGRHVIGRILGVDDAGALRLLVGSGEQHYSGGELSLRLIK